MYHYYDWQSPIVTSIPWSLPSWHQYPEKIWHHCNWQCPIMASVPWKSTFFSDATSLLNWYRCFFLQRTRELLSPVCGILLYQLSCAFAKILVPPGYPHPVHSWKLSDCGISLFETKYLNLSTLASRFRIYLVKNNNSWVALLVACPSEWNYSGRQNPHIWYSPLCSFVALEPIICLS